MGFLFHAANLIITDAGFWCQKGGAQIFIWTQNMRRSEGRRWRGSVMNSNSAGWTAGDPGYEKEKY